MRLFILLSVLLCSCSSDKRKPAEMIVGSWLYVTAERLGDNSQNDKAAITEFDKEMAGSMLTFHKDNTFEGSTLTGAEKNDRQNFLMQSGEYSITSQGDSMVLGRRGSIRISLTDTIFKFYSPDNGAFVWRRFKK